MEWVNNDDSEALETMNSDKRYSLNKNPDERQQRLLEAKRYVVFTVCLPESIIGSGDNEEALHPLNELVDKLRVAYDSLQIDDMVFLNVGNTQLKLFGDK